MAQKTFIIGLGTQGAIVCERIARKIIAEHGSLERVPWIKIHAFETESIEDSFLGRKGLASHLRIDRTNFTNMKNNQQLRDTLDLDNWVDWEGRLRNTDDIEAGANNIRMAGRLVFLESNNFRKFRDKITENLTPLTSLSETDAQEIRGPLRDGSNPAFKFEGGTKRVEVYVTGALTGGTASGSFIDVGYVLQHLPGRSDLQITGIFGVPFPTYENTVHWGNTYAALTELNHYDSKRYKAHFHDPTLGTHGFVQSDEKPYRRFYIMQPKNSDREALTSMNNGIAEFLYLVSNDSSAGKIEAEATNAFGNMSLTKKDKKGRRTTYGTLGVSLIEYPAEDIIVGGCSKAVVKFLDKWLTPKEITNQTLEHFYTEEMMLDPHSIEAALQVSNEGKSFDATFNGDLENAIKNQENRDSGALTRFESGLRQRVSLEVRDGKGYISGTAYDKIYLTCSSLTEARLKKLTEWVQTCLADPVRGPSWVKQVLEESSTKISNRLNEMDDLTFWKTQEDDLVNSLTNLAKLGIDVCSPLSFFARLFGGNKVKKTLVSRYRANSSNIVKSLWNAIELPVEKEILIKVRDGMELFLLRLKDPRYGLDQWGNDFLTRENAIVRSKVNLPLQINGEMLFDKSTIDNEYNRAFSTKQLGADAESRIGDFIKLKLKDFNAEPGRSSFDQAYYLGQDDRKLVSDFEIEELERLLRPYFSKVVGSDHILDRLVSESNLDWQIKVRRASEKATVAEIDYSADESGKPSNDGVDHRLKSFCFFNGANSSAKADSSKAKLLSEEVKRLHFTPLESDDDTHSIVFVQCVWNFAAGAFGSVEELGKHHLKNESFSRVGLTYQPLDGSGQDANYWYSLSVVLCAMVFGIISRTGSHFTFETKPKMGIPSKKIKLTNDISEIVDRINAEKLGSDIDLRLTEVLSSKTPEEIVEKVDSYYRTFENFKVTDGEKPFSSEDAVTRSELRLRQAPGVDSAWTTKIPTRSTVIKIDQDQTPKDGLILGPGFYCPRCYHFLATLEEGNSKVPTTCLNVKCAWSIIA